MNIITKQNLLKIYGGRSLITSKIVKMFKTLRNLFFII